MIRFVQVTPGMDMRSLVPRERFDQWVHEAGYAGMAVVAVWLFVVLVPFRRREPL